MNSEEAIKQLQKLKSDKQQQSADKTSNAFAKALSNLKNILVGVIVDTTSLIINHTFPVVVKNFPKTTTITNKEFDVVIKNFPKKEGIEKVEVINQPKFELNTSVIEARIDKLIKSGISVPLELISLKKIIESVGKKNYDCTDELCKIVSKLKLNPTINVESPKINIPAPIVNIPKTKFPEFPKKMEIINLDLSELVKNLEDIITELQYSQQKGIHITNPGDFPVSPSVATFKDTTGKATQVVLTSEGKVPVEITDELEGIATETTLQEIKNNQTDGSQKTQVVETIPTDTTKFNASTLISYNANDEAVYIDETFDGVTYRTIFTRSDMTVASTLPISAVTIL